MLQGTPANILTHKRGGGDIGEKVALGSVLAMLRQLCDSQVAGGPEPEIKGGAVCEKRTVCSQVQTVGCFLVILSFFPAEAPRPGARFCFLWLESSVCEKSTVWRRGRQPGRGRQTKLIRAAMQRYSELEL